MKNKLLLGGLVGIVLSLGTMGGSCIYENTHPKCEPAYRATRIENRVERRLEYENLIGEEGVLEAMNLLEKAKNTKMASYYALLISVGFGVVGYSNRRSNYR